MYCTLTPGIALRSWQLVPYAFYRKGQQNAQGLTKEEYELLSLCDGRHDVEESRLLSSLFQRGLCRPCEKGEEPGGWQKPRFCDNRYFPALNWAITGKCNYNCLHCFMAADNSPEMDEFSWEECVRLLDECGACGIQSLTLTGGEPMLHPHFMDLCREIARRDLWLSEITTNGSFITEAVLHALKELNLNPLIKISFDGLGYHDWMRSHSGAQEQALTAIRLCTAMDVKVRVQTNVHRLNADSIIPTAEYLDRLGVEQMRVIRTSEAPRWVQNAGDACLTLEEYYEAMLDFTKGYIARPRQMSVDIWQFLQLDPVHFQYHHRPAELGCGRYRGSFPVCRGNRGKAAVTPEGEAVPCNQLAGYYQKHGLSLGNVKRDGLQKLLQDSSYLTAVTTTVDQLFAANDICGSCKWRKICLGGCRAIALALTGDPMGTDPSKCIYFKGGYVERTGGIFPENWTCLDDLETFLE